MYIKREDAVKAIHDHYKALMATLPTLETEYGKVFASTKEVDEKCLVPNKEICKAIRAIPSADVVEVVRGAWILVCDAEGEGDNLYRCSVCGCEHGCQEYDLPNYCPNCGARMKGADDE